MTFKMYKYDGQRNVINKTLTYVADLTGYFKNDTSTLEPTLILAPGYSVTTENYFQIDGLYYFVNDVTRSQERLIVQLELDDIESYKSAILNQGCIVERSTNKFNAYQVDPDMPMINSSEITVTRFNGSFVGESLILAVAGGTPATP